MAIKKTLIVLLSLTTLGVVGISALKGINSNFVYHSMAEENRTISFSRSSKRQQIDLSSHSFRELTSGGNYLYLISSMHEDDIFRMSNDNYTMTHLAKGSSMPSTISFALDNRNEEPARFREIKSIIVNFSTEYTQKVLTLETSYDNKIYKEKPAITVAATATSYTFSDLKGARYLRINGYSLIEATSITGLTINYTCDGPKETPFVEDITISGQTTEFNVGDEFTFNGTAKAVFSDGHTETIDNDDLIIGDVDMSSKGTKTVNISYSINGKQISTSYSINVVESSSGEDGPGDETGGDVVFTAKSSTRIYTFTFSNWGQSSGTGTYSYKNTSQYSPRDLTISISWTLTGNTLRVNASNIDDYDSKKKQFGSYMPFQNNTYSSIYELKSDSFSFELYSIVGVQETVTISR